MSTDPIYLDHNATTPVAREVADAMWPFLTDNFGNPSSQTPQGIRARRAVERARTQVAELIGANPDEIVFTSGGTESNNLAIRGAAAHADTRLAVTSAVEHPATVAPLDHLRETHGWQMLALRVDHEARIRPADCPSGRVGLGTLILAHNEIGTIQPMREFADAIHAAGGLVHADGAQAIGKIAVSVDDLGVDLLSVAGHKMYAPKGVGALYVRRGTAMSPVLRGAGQERGLRPGTENVAGIVALGAAAELAGRLLDDEARRQGELREHLWQASPPRFPNWSGSPHATRPCPTHSWWRSQGRWVRPSSPMCPRWRLRRAVPATPAPTIHRRRCWRWELIGTWLSVRCACRSDVRRPPRTSGRSSPRSADGSVRGSQGETLPQQFGSGDSVDRCTHCQRVIGETVREDLRTLVQRLSRTMAAADTGTAFMLLQAGLEDPEPCDALEETVGPTGARLPQAVLDDAIVRGKLPSGAHPFVFEEVVGAVLLIRRANGLAIDDAYLTALIDFVVIPALTASAGVPDLPSGIFSGHPGTIALPTTQETP